METTSFYIIISYVINPHCSNTFLGGCVCMLQRIKEKLKITPHFTQSKELVPVCSSVIINYVIDPHCPYIFSNGLCVLPRIKEELKTRKQEGGAWTPCLSLHTVYHNEGSVCTVPHKTHYRPPMSTRNCRDLQGAQSLPRDHRDHRECT